MFKNAFGTVFLNLTAGCRNFGQIPTKFEGGARAKKTQFFGQNFPKKRLFFKNLIAGRRKFGQNRTFLVLWESLENAYGRPI